MSGCNHSHALACSGRNIGDTVLCPRNTRTKIPLYVETCIDPTGYQRGPWSPCVILPFCEAVSDLTEVGLTLPGVTLCSVKKITKFYTPNVVFQFYILFVFVFRLVSRRFVKVFNVAIIARAELHRPFDAPRLNHRMVTSLLQNVSEKRGYFSIFLPTKLVHEAVSWIWELIILIHFEALPGMTGSSGGEQTHSSCFDERMSDSIQLAYG